MSFDFDYWLNLHKSDPIEFERQRLQIVENEIKKLEEKAPERAKRYRAMMWAYEQRLSLVKDDKERFNRVVETFWKQFDEFNNSLGQLFE